ncbi:MAG: hypothetical protein QOH68_651 [Nocardioidaceae bacterium]|nr:hypothetical protein [Nocardioidaceae bacterium]
MQAERYVLFEVKGRSRGVGGPLESAFGSLGAEADAQLDLQTADLTPSEAATELGRPGVVGARSMPLALINPTAAGDAQRPDGPGVTWGVKAVGADTSPFTGAGIKVAVLDTGIDADHEVFAGATVTQMDFTGSGDGDMHGHGTHCAGTIAGRDVNGFRIGVAPGVPEILAGKVLGESGGSTETLLKAMQWALDSGANVISMSLGIDFPGQVQRSVDEFGMNIQQATSRALEDYRRNLALFGALANFLRLQSLNGQPVVVVAATGNESERAAAKAYTVAISPPAASDGFIGVGAIGQRPDGNFEIAPFSNTGAAVVGPGVDVLSAKPGGGYQTMNGTSMATPHAAGVAALWAESIQKTTGSLTADAIAAKLRANGRFDPTFDPIDVGAGLVQAPG